MKIAIMQPYVFPYIGYFQLIYSVQKFIVYDDVNFIKGGWINRNKIISNNKESLFTIPLKKVSPFKLINETEIDATAYSFWKKKFLKSIEQTYKKAPHFEETFNLIQGVLSTETNLISELATESIKKVSDLLKLDTAFISSSTIYSNNNLKGQERVIDICLREDAKTYINPIGGVELYENNSFDKLGINLLFLNSINKPYKQFENIFISRLSIIDVLMFNNEIAITNIMNSFELVKGKK